MKQHFYSALFAAFAIVLSLGLVACDDDDDSTDAPQTFAPMSVSQDLAKSWMDLFDPTLNSWHWDSAILMLGMMELSASTGDTQFRDYAQAWMDYHIREGYFITSSDTSIPGRVALKLYEETGDAKYKQVADEVWDYIQNKAVRTNDGGLNHLGNLTDREIWVDTLFMVGPFLIEYGRLIGSSEPIDEFKLQLNVFRNRLRDQTTGMYYHRYNEVEDSVTPSTPVFWGRGNGWVFVASNFGRLEAEAEMTSPDMYDIASDIQMMNDFVVQNLRSDGVFHTLVNRPDSYLETSAGMLWAYGLTLGMESGVFSDAEWPLVVQLLNGGLRNVIQAAHGEWQFLGVSYGTSPGDFDYYQEVLKGENVAYGLGAFMLAAAQAEKVRPAGATAEFDLAPDGSLTNQSSQVKPEPCQGVECGQFFITRGHFTNALLEFEQVLAADPDNVAANYYTGLINFVRVITTYIVLADAVPTGDLTEAELLQWFRGEATTKLRAAIAGLEFAAQDPTFETDLERLLIFESGGHTAIGAREYDQGDALLVQGICHAMIGGLPLLTDASAGTDDDLDEILLGLDKLEAGLVAIMAETDDQSDDFIPANLFEGTGTFTIPGVLPPTETRELLLSLGVTEEAIDNGTADQTILGLLNLAKQLLPGLLASGGE